MTALLLAVALHPQLSYELKWRPAKGDTLVYEFFLKDSEISVEASVEHKVGQVDDGGYSVESRSLGALVRIAGSEIKDDRPNASTATFDPFGKLKEIKGGTDGLEKYRNLLLTSFVAPPRGVDLGGKWTYERQKDQPKGLAACVIEYQLVGVKEGLAEVKFKLTEKGGDFPQSATGTWWIDTSKKWVAQKFEAKVKNFVGSENPETEVRFALRKTD